jgi:peroxiredoxin
MVVVPHEVQRILRWQETAGEEILVLADGGFRVSTLYSVAFQMRVHTDTSNTPGTYLIDKSGAIRFAHLGQGPRNFHDRPSVETVIAEIDSWSDH